MADQVASVEIQAKSAGVDAQLREALSKFSHFADSVASKMAKADKKTKSSPGIFGKGGFSGALGKSLTTAGGNLIASAVSTGVGALESAGESAFTYNEHLARLQILANSTPEAMNAFSESVKRSSTETGKSRLEILDAASAYVALTGDMDVARNSISTWTKVAQATGSTVSDIAGAAAALTTNLHVTSSEMGDVFGAIASQGKAGAIEIKDLAAQLSNVAPMWSEFKGGTGGQAAKDIGAALQVGKRGFGGDASETVTGLRDMLVGLTKNAAKFEAAGVKIYDKDNKGKKSLRSVLDIVDGISASKLMDDPTFLEKTFGRDTGRRFFDEVHKGRDDLEKMRTTADGMGMINKDLDKYLASPAGRAVVAFNKLKNVFADLFTPERIAKFAAILERVLPAVGKVADFVSNAVGAIDHFVNGGSDQEQSDDTARELANGANTGNPVDEKRMVDLAREMVSNKSDSSVESMAGLLGLNPDRSNAGSMRKGALRFLKDEGVDTSAWGDLAGGAAMDPTQALIARTSAGTKQITAKDIAAAITAGMKDLHITIAADGAAIATVVKNAPTARLDVKK